MSVSTVRGAHAADPTPGLEAHDLSRAFGDVRALDHVDLVVPRGGVTALVGPNGCGKTSLMLVLASLLSPDTGHVRVLGVDPAKDPRGVRRLLGWMPDGFGTFEALTVREVLRTMAGAHGLGAGAARPRVEELLHTLRLDPLADRPARVLSRGQKQRLGLAQAMVHSPQVLVLDEPASGLDPRSRLELRDTVRALAAGGVTVLVSSHILDELEEMCDRAVVMDAGRVVASHDLTAAPALLRWRVGSLDVEALRAVLAARGIEATDVPSPDGDWGRRGALDVDVADEADAHALLRLLVDHDVPVFTFGPATTGGRLEAMYLSATREERS
ncbi:ABC transporter ATP-binding protein [Agilicoccus flavus]|uniref:ABC transporter ATP-binding protein n=1 Tax=Agilicoccus flavus TaxID=2775968 RepID=UPI001CF6FCF0|nr:ABC transporter ATP-binding protein [Agilicoccus flavus]